MFDALRPHGLYAAHQAPLSIGFSRQEYWRGLPWLIYKVVLITAVQEIDLVLYIYTFVFYILILYGLP